MVEAKSLTGLRFWIQQTTPQDRTDGVKLVLERGDDAEVPAASSNRPEEVFVLLNAGRQQLSIRGDYIGREQIVAGKPVFTIKPSDATSEGEPCDTGHRNDPEGSRQPEPLGLVVELAQREARLSFRGSSQRIDPDTFHGR